MEKLPITVGQSLSIRPKDREYFHINKKILGARPYEFIIVDKLVVEMNERLFTPLEGEIACNFIFQGNAYFFETDILDTISYNITLIRYPVYFETRSLRKYIRIPVRIPVVAFVESANRGIEGIIEDISEGGCRVSLTRLFYAYKNMKCVLNFELPNRKMIRGLRANIRSIEVNKLKQTIQLGLQFTKPRELIGEVVRFCRFCRRFKL